MAVKGNIQLNEAAYTPHGFDSGWGWLELSYFMGTGIENFA